MFKVWQTTKIKGKNKIQGFYKAEELERLQGRKKNKIHLRIDRILKWQYYLGSLSLFT